MPCRSLAGFDRVFLDPGQSESIPFPVTAFALAFGDDTSASPQLATDSGRWRFSVDDAAVFVSLD